MPSFPLLFINGFELPSVHFFDNRLVDCLEFLSPSVASLDAFNTWSVIRKESNLKVFLESEEKSCRMMIIVQFFEDETQTHYMKELYNLSFHFFPLEMRHNTKQ